MNKLKKLQSATTLGDFALLIGYKPKALSYILYKMPKGTGYYNCFDIPKKNGGNRHITAPNNKLKEVQKRLADLLYDCCDIVSEAEDKPKKPVSYGFKKNYSIFDNSRNHCKRRYVFNIDLKDFFSIINFGRVRGFFIRDKNFKLNEKIATIIAQIACFENKLPQGSPSSPIISNLIGNILDMRLVKLAKDSKCTYSRYVDDLTFSTNNKFFPDAIAKYHKGKWLVGKKLKEIIKNAGFFINEEKISMQYKTSRQTCVGLVVNKKVNIKQSYYRNIRAMCNSLFKNNYFFIDGKKIEGASPRLNGLLDFVYSIRSNRVNKRLSEEKRKKLHKDKRKLYSHSGIKELYKKFLFFKFFVNPSKPLILTEGSTDIIYLKCALKNLHQQYSAIVDFNDNKFEFKINFFKFSGLFKEIFATSNGTGGLENIINYYETNNLKFDTNNTTPIIVVVDNDDGAKRIKNKINDKLDPNGLYAKYFRNLFILFVSKDNIEIEQLFDNKTLNTEIEGKKFNRDKEFDTSKYYGKQIFAKKVILPKWKEIDFGKFKPIFENLTKIINFNNAKVEKISIDAK